MIFRKSRAADPVNVSSRRILELKHLGRAWRWFVVAAALAAIGGLAAVGWTQLTKPKLLKVAVGPAGFVDAELLAAFSRILNANKAGVRVTVEATSGPNEALGKLESGDVQLAVMRGDGGASERIRSVAVLHTDPVVIVAPETAKVDDFGDLKRKMIGVIGPPGADEALVATLQNQYGIVVHVKALPLAPAVIAAAIRDKSVDALLFVVPTSRASKVGQTWMAVMQASRRKLAFVPIEDAAAIAAMSPSYEAGEIVAGQFGGSPILPEESVTTLQVATYLVADRGLSNDVVTDLTRALFEERQKMSADAPIASLIKAASTEKDAIFPVHAGAKAYYDGEETTLMERYGDWLFYGPMLLGALGSALLGVRRFLQSDEAGPPLLPRFSAVLATVKEARSLPELDEVRADIDAAVEKLARTGVVGASDQERAAITAMVLLYLNHVIAERRDVLLGPQINDVRTAGPARAAGQLRS